MRSSEAFPSKYLKSADAKAKQIVTTISHLETEPVGQDKEEKHVLYFEDQKPLVVNKTNFEAIEEAFGDSDEWSGHKIKIYCVKTTYQGKSVDGLRVKPIVPKPTLKEDLDDDIPEFGDDSGKKNGEKKKK
jgi:hypothetical protein